MMCMYVIYPELLVYLVAIFHYVGNFHYLGNKVCVDSERKKR